MNPMIVPSSVMLSTSVEMMIEVMIDPLIVVQL
jgi:hypothetical protein